MKTEDSPKVFVSEDWRVKIWHVIPGVISEDWRPKIPYPFLTYLGFDQFLAIFSTSLGIFVYNFFRSLLFSLTTDLGVTL